MIALGHTSRAASQSYALAPHVPMSEVDTMRSEASGFGPFLDGYDDASLQLRRYVYGGAEEQFQRWEQHKDALASVRDVRGWQQHLKQHALQIGWHTLLALHEGDRDGAAHCPHP